LGSYSELATDAYLLREVGNGKSVSIIGCPHCANQSIAYAKDISVIGKSMFGGLIYTPYALTEEASRIKELFKTKGISANVKIFSKISSPPCWLHEKERKMIAKTCEHSDAVVTLCCSAGREGIKTALSESFKVVPGMVTVGAITAYLKIQNGKDILDKTRTKVVHFKEMKQTVK
jgi:hypothetical protein